MSTFNSTIHGFEDPTKRLIQATLTLNELLVLSPSSTQIISAPRAFSEVGIEQGDWLIVNATLKPRTSDLILAELWGELIAASYTSMKSTQYSEELCVLGVIQQSIHFLNSELAPVLPEHSNLLDLDLHRTIVTKDLSTIFLNASGNAMAPTVNNGDLLVLERHLIPKDGDALVMSYQDQLVFKRVNFTRRELYSDADCSIKQYVSNDVRIKFHGVVNTAIRLHRPL